MRTLTLILAICALCGNTFALAEANELQFHDHAPLIQHLTTVNSNWDGHQSHLYGFNVPVSFISDKERIYKHLRLVVEYLRAVPKQAGQSNEVYSIRMALIDTLKQYANRKDYPVNTRHMTRTPYFIDDYGTACAVGYLLLASGSMDLVKSIRKNFNYRLIEDIQVLELGEWADSHGFTVEELKLIQPTYMSVLKIKPVGLHADSTVRCIISTQSEVFIGGDFSMIGFTSCSGLASAIDSTTSCFSSFSGGKIISLANDSENMYVAGKFVFDNKVYGLVKTLSSTTEPIHLEEGYQYNGLAIHWTEAEGYLSECNVSDPTDCHIWRNINGEWNKIASIAGHVNTIASYNGQITLAGAFDTITAHQTTGDSSFYAQNIVRLSNENTEWTNYPDEIDNEVFALEAIGSELFVGGRCVDSLNGSRTFCAMKYSGGVFKSIIPSFQINHTDNNTAVYDFAYIEPTKEDTMRRVLVAGNIQYKGGFSHQFYGLAEYIPLLGGIRGYGHFDGPVYAVEETQGGLYIAGNFDSTHFYSGLGNLCFLPYKTAISDTTDTATSIAEVAIEANSIVIYPNPASSIHNLQLPINLKEVKIATYDSQGRQIRGWESEKVASGLVTRDLSSLESGMYYYVISNGDKTWTAKFIKQGN